MDGFDVTNQATGIRQFQVDPNGHLNAFNMAAALGALAANYTLNASTASDNSGVVSVTTGATAPAVGTVLTVTFAVPYVNPPAVVIGGPLGVYATAVTATGFTITVASAPAINTTYAFAYMVRGQNG